MGVVGLLGHCDKERSVTGERAEDTKAAHDVGDRLIEVAGVLLLRCVELGVLLVDPVDPHAVAAVVLEGKTLLEGTIMSTYSILPDGKLAITASQSSSQHDFDFLVGGWKIRNRKLKEPLSGRDEWDEFDATQNLRQILVGFGNFDSFSTEFDGKPFEGFTLRLFDPQTRLWTIYWADSKGGKLDGGKVGSFDGDTGEFFAREVFAGRNIIVKFYWDKRNPEAPVWSAAYSVDEGQTWEWNWYANFARR